MDRRASTTDPRVDTPTGAATGDDACQPAADPSQQPEASAGCDRPTKIPVAFLARVGGGDLKDRTLSISRQLNHVRASLPHSCAIVAYFWDVELDGKPGLPVPPDGGIRDLLREASRAQRRFVAVGCESVDRLGRTASRANGIEQALEHAGVALLVADEGDISDVLATNLPVAGHGGVSDVGPSTPGHYQRLPLTVRSGTQDGPE